VSENEVFAKHKQTQFASLLAIYTKSPCRAKMLRTKYRSTEFTDAYTQFKSKTQQHLKTPAHTQITAANNTTPARTRVHATA